MMGTKSGEHDYFFVIRFRHPKEWISSPIVTI
jgi:hypothetical protein